MHTAPVSSNRDNLPEYYTGGRPRLFGARVVALERFEEEARPVRDRLRFEVPLYALTDAARIVDVPVQTLSRWTRGSAAVTWKRPAGRGYPSIPFVGLAEALVLAALRRSGVPMQRIRPALQALEAELGLEHALASRRLYTDGAELLFDYADAHISGELLSSLVVVRSGQRVFAEAVKAYLDRITYGEDGYPTLIRVPAYRQAEVVVDPSMSFGSPIFRAGAPGLRMSWTASGRASPWRMFLPSSESRSTSWRMWCVSHPAGLPDLFIDRSPGITAARGKPGDGEHGMLIETGPSRR